MNLHCEARPKLYRPRRSVLARVATLLLGAWAAVALLAAPAEVYAKPFDLAGFVRTDPRAQAMGNAFGAIARGDTALYYNPAGMVQDAFEIHLEGSGVALADEAFLSDIYAMFSGSPTPADINTFLANNLGTTQYFNQSLNYSATASLAAFKMGVGGAVRDQTQYRFTFTDQTSDGFTPDDTMTEDERGLSLTSIAAAFPLLEGQLLLGVTLKRFSIDDKTASDTFGNIAVNGVQLITAGDSYTGSAYDLGILWRMETFAFLRGQFSVVANNIGGVSLTDSVTANTLEIPATYDLGFVMNPELKGSPLHLLITADYEDVTGAVKVQDLSLVNHDRSTRQRLHLGAELGFWQTGAGNNVLSVRFGSNKGQPTYGAELNFSVFRLLYARYKDDVGYDALKDVHTFKTLQVSLGIGF